jgi:hypothetical protein
MYNSRWAHLASFLETDCDTRVLSVYTDRELAAIFLARKGSMKPQTMPSPLPCVQSLAGIVQKTCADTVSSNGGFSDSCPQP